MKKTYWFSVIFISLFSCNKNGEGVAPKSYFCGKLNGEKWSGNVWAYPDSNNTCYISIVVYEKQIIRETLVLGKVNIQKGRQTLKPITQIYSSGSSYYTLLADDVLCDTYALWQADSVNNYVEITDFDIENKRFEGTFSASYLREQAFICDNTKPDTMHFRDCKFFVKLKKKKN